MKDVLHFLRQLCVNNNRNWFDDNRPLYKATKQIFEAHVQELIEGVRKFDSTIPPLQARECIFRINRDTRFSNDKTPYKNNFGAFVTPHGKSIVSAGYYLHIEPDAAFISGGIYLPPSPALMKIRTAILHNPSGFIETISSEKFVKYFGHIDGEKLKTAPKGFPKDFEHIDLLKFKSYTMMHTLTDEFIEQGDVVGYALELFAAMKDFNQFLNKALEG